MPKTAKCLRLTLSGSRLSVPREAAAVKAKAILEKKYSAEEIASLDKEAMEEAFAYGETRKSEEERLVREVIRKKA